MTAPATNAAPAPKLTVRDLCVYYGETKGVGPVTMDIVERHVTAFIGPSGCGKSTYLRALNRMNELIPGCRMTGEVKLDGEAIYGPGVDPVSVRRRIGMVFQRSNPFPKSIAENVAYGLRIGGLRRRARDLDARRARPAAGGPVGRGQGSPARQRPRHVGRPAAAALHRAGPRRRARRAAHGRAGVGPRSHRDGAHRRAHQRDLERIHRRHRDPQHAAGGPRRRLHGLLLHGRARRVRPHRRGYEFTKPSNQRTEDYITGRFGRRESVAASAPPRG